MAGGVGLELVGTGTRARRGAQVHPGTPGCTR